MNVSREYLLGELEAIGKVLKEWEDTIRNPEVIPNGGPRVPAYPEGVPQYISVSEMVGVDVGQLKAEMAAVAGRLETLVVT